MNEHLLNQLLQAGLNMSSTFRVVGRGLSGTDIVDQVNAAIREVSSSGGGTVFVERGSYPVNGGRTINPRSNVHLIGHKHATNFYATTDGYIIEGDGTAFENFTIEDMLFTGTVNQTVPAPARWRTTTGPGTTQAIRIRGDLDPNGTVGLSGTTGQTGLFPKVSNVTIKGCTFRNIHRGEPAIPPALLAGIRGVANIIECHFYNTLDCGFIFCENAKFLSNHVEMSSDNGVSMSRGNQKVVVVGNTFENIAYMGIWISGWTGQIGPKDITCTGNVVRNCGRDGILLIDAPMTGVISGNTIDRGYYRGSVEAPQDSSNCGIFVRGYPNGAPTTMARELLITDNVIKGSAKAGIFIDTSSYVVVKDNFIIDPGTERLADKTTVIAADDVTQNIGILLGQKCTKVQVKRNEIHDGRATKLANFGVYPPTVATCGILGNSWSGMRGEADADA